MFPPYTSGFKRGMVKDMTGMEVGTQCTQRMSPRGLIKAKRGRQTVCVCVRVCLCLSTLFSYLTQLRGKQEILATSASHGQ